MNTPVLMKSEEERAPWNDHLPVRHRRFVSVTLSYYTDVEGDPDMSEYRIKDYIEDDIRSWVRPKDFCIDDLEILKDE